jgi:hypothetical protein|tara:strand:- start:1477 stop:2118 length:642 start_codon:yes stop_codon:yes gene_type:complete
MMQLNSFFRNTIFLIILPLISFGEKIKIPNILFSEIEISQQEFNDSKYNSQSFSCLMPLKIITYEIEKFYSELGSLTKEKKILMHTIKNKNEQLKLSSLIVKKNKRSFIYVTDMNEKEEEENKLIIKNLLLSIKKILKKRYINDYIKEIESDIKKIDKKQNKLIRKNPKYLEINSMFFYKLFQKNESKKVALKISLEKLYEELDEAKAAYNNI